MPNRTIAPNYFDPIEFDLKLKPYQYFTLDNKAPVYSVHTETGDVAMVEFVFYAGNWFEKQNMLAATTNFLIKNGTKNKSAFDINEFFEFEGAYLSRACYNETATITLHCLSKHLPILLPIVAELLTESNFPTNEISIYKQNRKQQLSVNLLKCDFVADRLIDEYLYGSEHPYGKYSREEDIDNIQQEDLQQYFNQYYTHGDCMLFAAGNLPSNIQELLNKSFGQLPFQIKEKNHLEGITYTRFLAEEKTQSILNDPNGVQGAVRIARPFPDKHHPDFQKVQVLNTIFGGYFGSRLMSNIREEKGYTYGISSYIQNHMHDSAWMISTEAKREACPMVIEEIWKEASILQEELIDDEELELVKNYMIGSILSSLDGAFSIIGRWKGYIMNGFTGNKFYENIEVIKSIQADELQAMAQKYLRKEDFYQLTVI
ncbi:MAG: insulinase family protein [Pseudopedobacter saltans]|uniref:Insulinase family protein n=1 Tax=Pseudopedobacter saltans TaxID=151895 RepID=A0A2W5F7T3_9SPHI|nr:MAG: insulinase family protein [Pseudopedobacter saltans]